MQSTAWSKRLRVTADGTGVVSHVGATLDADGEVRKGAQVAELSQLLQAYVAELDQPFPDGFDPGRSISASAQELRAPAGVVLLATLDGQPVGCGAV